MPTHSQTACLLFVLFSRSGQALWMPLMFLFNKIISRIELSIMFGKDSKEINVTCIYKQLSLHSVTLAFGFVVSGGPRPGSLFNLAGHALIAGSFGPTPGENLITRIWCSRSGSNKTLFPPASFTARPWMPPFKWAVWKSRFSQGFWKRHASDVASVWHAVRYKSWGDECVTDE